MNFKKGKVDHSPKGRVCNIIAVDTIIVTYHHKDLILIVVQLYLITELKQMVGMVVLVKEHLSIYHFYYLLLHTDMLIEKINKGKVFVNNDDIAPTVIIF